MFPSLGASAQSGPTPVLSLRRSIFDIVYQTTPNRHWTPARPARPQNRPVNFLYMGLFLRFQKR
jgi:hypothetical protein